jgi:DNA modification methylase
VALELGRNALGIELNPKYVEIIRKRIPSLSEHSIFRRVKNV